MLRPILAAVAALSVGSCAYTPKVQTDFDPATNFSQYRTFNTIPGRIISSVGVVDTNNTLMSERVNNAVASTLRSKGLEQNVSNPDLLVTFLAGAKDKTEIESAPAAPAYYGPYGYGYGGWWGTGYNQFWTRQYKEGTLIVDLIDAKAKRLVWRAYCVSEISKDNAENRNRLQSCLDQGFAKFPPGSAAPK